MAGVLTKANIEAVCIGAVGEPLRDAADQAPTANPALNARVGFNVSSHCDMGSMSGRHGGKMEEDAASEASTADTVDAELNAALEPIVSRSITENPEMEEVYADCLAPAIENPGVGSLATTARCTTQVMNNFVPQVQGMESLINDFCTPGPLADEATRHVLELQRTARLAGLKEVFDKIRTLSSNVLDAQKEIQMFTNSRKLGVQCIRLLQAEFSKANPNQGLVDRLCDKAAESLRRAEMSETLEKQLTDIKTSGLSLVEKVREEIAALDELKATKEALLMAAEARAKAVVEEATRSVKSQAKDAAKTAGWWSCLSVAALVGLTVVGGVCIGAACIASGGAAVGVVAPALIAAGHIAGWGCLGGTAVIGVGSIFKARWNAARIEKELKDGIESATRTQLEESARVTAAYRQHLENIQHMAEKYEKLTKDLECVSEASEVVKAHVVFLATEGDDVCEKLEFAELVREIKPETIQKFETTLEQLKSDVQEMVDCASESKRFFIASKQRKSHAVDQATM